MLLRRLTVAFPKIINRTKFASTLGIMREGFVEINSVPTHICTWGKWIEEELNEKTKDLVLIVSGNPGLPGFYLTFAQSLYNEFDETVPIWVIGHAGHDEPSKELKLKTPPLKGNENLYNLQGQIKHKVEFIERYIPKNINVHLIGHSVGAKICLDLLKHKQFSEQVQHLYLMFPTIERIGDSKNGLRVPTYDRFFFLFRIFYNIFALFPTSWRRALVRWLCRRDGVPDKFIQPTMQYTNPRVIDRIWFMALDEMEKIRDLDEDVIRSNLSRLKLYYGIRDDWVRDEAYAEISEKFPGIDAEQCKQGYEHAFVLKTGPEVAKLVSQWIKEKKQKNTIVKS